MDLARAHQRGMGRPRDYHAAADAYRRGCDAGDAVACRLYGAEILIRRADATLEIGDAASQRACTLGDIVACWELSEGQLLSEYVRATSEASKKAADDAHAARRALLLPRLQDACGRGEIAACELVPCDACECPEERCEAAKQERERALCVKGSDTACALIVTSECTFDEHCLAELARSSSAELRAAIEHVRRGCDSGDPDLCLALGRPVPWAELCAAHDQLACRMAEEERTKATK